MRFLYLASILLSVLSFKPNAFAQSFDLTPVSATSTDQKLQMSTDQRFLSVTSNFQNIGTDDIIQPYNIGWYLSPYPTVGCSQISTNTTTNTASYFVGFDFVAGTPAQATRNGKLSHIELATLKNKTGAITSGWYCLWTTANYNQRFTETNSDNNSYIFQDPICIGGNCQTLSLKVYPVPAHDHLTVELPVASNGFQGTVTILDMGGRKAMEQEENFAAGQSKINLSIQNLAAGDYLISVKSKDQTWHSKFIKR